MQLLSDTKHLSCCQLLFAASIPYDVSDAQTSSQWAYCQYVTYHAASRSYTFGVYADVVTLLYCFSHTLRCTSLHYTLISLMEIDEQKANEFVITWPASYHGGFNHGCNVAESSNFAVERWLTEEKLAKTCM